MTDTLYAARYWPELVIVPLAGVFLRLRATPPDVRLATLTVVLIVGSTVGTGKVGAAVNDFLCLHGIEGLAAGAFWKAAWSDAVRARWAALGACVPVLALPVVSVWPQAGAASWSGSRRRKPRDP